MSADHVSVAAALAGLAAAGAAVVSAVTARGGGPTLPMALRSACALALGWAAVGVTMFTASVLGVSWGAPWLLAAPWILGFAVAWARARRARVTGSRVAPVPTEDDASRGGAPTSRPVRAIEPLLVLVIVFNLGASAAFALDKPLWQYDAITRWGFKARAFTHDRSVVPYFEDLERGVTQPHYPPLVPLGMTWVDLQLGRNDARLSKALFPFCYAALLLGLYGLIRRRASSTVALAGAALLSMTPCLSYLEDPTRGTGAHAALADVPLALVTLLSVGLLLEACRTGARGAWLLSFLLAGVAPWIKQEGVLLLALNPALLLVAGRAQGGWVRRGRAALLGVLVAAAVFAPWYLFQRGVPITDDVYLPVDFSAARLRECADRLPVIGLTFARELVAFDRWGLLWVVAAIVLSAAPRVAWRRGAGWVVLVVVAHAAIYAVVYALEDFHGVGAYEQKMTVSLTRLLSHLAPLAVLAAAWQADALLRPRAPSSKAPGTPAPRSGSPA